MSSTTFPELLNMKLNLTRTKDMNLNDLLHRICSCNLFLQKTIGFEDMLIIIIGDKAFHLKWKSEQ